jgi:hypothetical protein
MPSGQQACVPACHQRACVLANGSTALLRKVHEGILQNITAGILNLVASGINS